MRLTSDFLARPLAHRGLHDVTDGRPENSLEAFEAAISAGYGIELDIQPSADGVPMVFHDYDLARLAGIKGPIAQCSTQQLEAQKLVGGPTGIPTLKTVLECVRGKVPLLIEIKDQDGAMGRNVGALEREVTRVLSGYPGPAAVMSFNPNSVDAFKTLCPHRPRGLVTCGYSAADWPILPFETRRYLRDIPDFEAVGASFVSHDRNDLKNPALTGLKANGVPILTWTVRSAEQATTARLVADNITFEGFMA
ncbi:glycerophosphodiester phosphodiesterase family protein [Algirhabdus cladophorae]|uniref:glycerophosphodiester phosphodiesterase family protein n=1 Tax=Algirhabdus cladophorae TaxID=3377108 RepID=UPI003B845D08